MFNEFDLAYYFLRVGEFAVVNGIVVDSETKQPVFYNTNSGQKYISYSPDNPALGHSVVNLDVTKNNKIVETLYNHWCTKQYVNGLYIRYTNVYHKDNSKHTKDTTSEVIAAVSSLDENGNPIGQSYEYKSGFMANDAMAFSYIMTEISELDTDEILKLNANYKPIGENQLC